ncbi:MAG: hypothetical protein ACFE96_12420, partial [Candidatus Hermodarchaeota archaeon]
VHFSNSKIKHPPRESVLDLWIHYSNPNAWRPINDKMIHALIEAKRAHPDLKNWVFFNFFLISKG